MLNAFRMVVMMALVAIALSGCGKKGPLEVPSSAAANANTAKANTANESSENTETSDEQTQSTDSGTGTKTKKPKPSNKIAAAPTLAGTDKNNKPGDAPTGPHQSFFLDPLLK